MNIDKTQIPAPGAREIPTPPGGGSWTFDPVEWAWVSNDLSPPPANETPAAAVAFDDAANQE
ncbi:MAG: hypothetical protein RR775_10090 [Massilia sp.]|uniref:hypothetical protein n=1 Tax=Massilia sp. TaxID=1882437 RepID=UPI002FC6FBAE